MLRKVLVVDDNEINRQILHKILCEEYRVLEARDGAEALLMLKGEYENISAVLLDIFMPQMDGYDVLKQIENDSLLSSIPVIIMTGSRDPDAENRALSLGANDFITKPYNPNTIKQRLRNIIKLRETAAIVNLAKRDDLTGLYNRKTFFEIATEMIAAHEPGYYVIACFDIDNFKVINDQYGSEKGDVLLKTIANIFKERFDKIDGLCCRITSDDFAALYPHSFMNTPEIENIRNLVAQHDGSIPPITFRIGRYIIDDLSLPVSGMYDRASIAENSIKGRFDKSIALYDESMRTQLLHQQKIISEMKSALESEQFEVWFQPQFNHSTGALIGAEALVRWRHPENGLLISPVEFIPVFERNGFVYELDKYVWEKSCALLRKWIDAGNSPLPLSVNISRYDVFREDFIGVITGLVKKYDLPVSLLRLEITETAFAESTEQIITTVKYLIDYGFMIEIDDFGSGYSSLNTLKDVPAQVLKLDMRFLENDSTSQRSGNIIESVVRMAKWLGMSVIAEGVETVAQADYLKSIGCNYVQGYLYARPMDQEEYEALAQGIGKEEKLLVLETVENLDNNAFWDPNSMDTLIFNSYVGGACIFEYHNGNVEFLRTNEKFIRAIGSVGMSVDDALKLHWIEYMDNESRALVDSSVKLSRETGDEVIGEYIFLNLPGCPEITYLRSTLRVIATAGDRYLVYCTHRNITREREAEQKIKSLNKTLSNMMNDAPGGFVRMRIDENGTIRTEYVNERFCKIRGMTHEEILEADSENSLNSLHPDDEELVRNAVAEMVATNQTCTIRYRLSHSNGGYIWVLVFGRITRNEAGEIFINAYYTDVTEEKMAEDEMKKVQEEMKLSKQLVDDSSAAVYVCDAETYEMLYVNDKCAKMCGKTIQEAKGKTCYAYLMGSDKPCEPCYMETSVYGKYTEGEYTSSNSGKHYMARGKFIDWGEHRALVEYLNDITESVNLRLKVQANNSALRVVSKNIEFAFWQYDIDKRLITFEDYRFEPYLGYPMVMENMPDYMIDTGDVYPDDADKFRQMYEELQNGAESCECTARVLNRDTGQYVWNHTVYTRLYDPFYTTRQAIGFAANVNLQIANALRYEHETQLRKELIKDAIIYYELNLTSSMIVEYRTHLDDDSGMKPNIPVTDEIRSAILDEVDEPYRDAVKNTLFSKALMAAYQRGESSVGLTYRRNIKGGDMHWVRATGVIMKLPEADDIVAFLYFNDVDIEIKDRLALDSVVAEEVDSLLIVNIKNGKARWIKEGKADHGVKLQLEFDYDEYISNIISKHIVDEDVKSCEDFFPLDRLVQQLEESKSATLTYSGRLCNGSIVRNGVTAYYLDDIHESIVISKRDISELYEEEEQQKAVLQAAVDVANEANRAKSEFLSRMSHDMRTPMNAIIGLINLAKKEANPLKTREYLDNMRDSSHFLMGLISDVLDLSKIESGRLELNEEPYTYGEFLGAIDTIIRPLMEEKNIEFVCNMGFGAEIIITDKLRFKQIFFNLLSNAAKYTPRNGRVEFIAERISDKDGKLGMRHYIRDNGCGMSAEFLKIIFEPFSQERNSAVSERQGSGLGLAIVKNIVTAMDGDIRVTSTLGKGSEFIVDLYVRQGSKGKTESVVQAADYSSLEGVQLLLVEDNAMNILVAEKLLESKGCIVSVARNGVEAVQTFSRSAIGHYRAVLMDIRMPDMDGIEATKKIRALDRADAETVPIIAMTADTFIGDKNNTLELAMDAYIAKPIDSYILFSTLQKLITRS